MKKRILLILMSTILLMNCFQQIQNEKDVLIQIKELSAYDINDLKFAAKEFSQKNNEDTLCRRGIELAIDDMENDKIGFFFYGEPMARDEIYYKVLKENYSIDMKGGGCGVERHGICYNEIMKEVILKKFGKPLKEISDVIKPLVDSLHNVLGPKGPEYKKGYMARLRDVDCNLYIPKEAEDFEEAPLVIVEFTVDTSGKAINPKIEKGFSKLFDDEALKAVSYLGDWNPAIYNGIKTEQKVSIPIRFSQATKIKCD